MNSDFLRGDAYREELKSGGTLVITKTAWRIEYLFEGKDRRYLVHRYSIYGYEIDEYIAAWKSNFKKFSILKSTISNSAGEYRLKGEKGMIISVGGEYPNVTEGVCLEIYYYRQKLIWSETQLDAIIADYEMAKKKAVEIQAVLNQI